MLNRPDLKQIEAQKILEEAKNPPVEKPQAKKWFNPSGGSSTFAQIMRQEMSKTHEKGPKKVDQTQYKEIMKEQAQQHASLISGAATEANDSPPVKREAWRKGDVEAEAIKEAQAELLSAQTPIMQADEKKLSKHAKRRANKKKKIVVSNGGAEEDDEYNQGGADEDGADQA